MSNDEKSIAEFKASAPARSHVQVFEANEANAVSVVDNAEDLAALGIKQEFKREFTRWSTLSYAISVMGVLGSVPASINYPLSAAGPSAAVWCWGVGSLFSFLLASSIAELVSAYPTAGGMYFVTKHVVPQDKVPLLAWVIGWASLLGQSAGIASIGYSVGQMIMACVTMASDDYDPVTNTFSYTPTQSQIVGVTVAVLFAMACVNSLATKHLAKLVQSFAPINIVGSVAISIALLVLTKDKHSASWVFGHITEGSGWGSKGFSFMLGFLSVCWTMTDYDATAHLSEETRSAAIRGPVAITQAVIASFIFGELLCIAICFCCGDLDRALNSQTGLVTAQVMFDAGGKSGGLAMFFWVILIQWFAGCSTMLGTTRTAYALARDGALPLSRVWSKVNRWTRTPLNAVILVWVFCSCLVLIGLGSPITIAAIFNVTAPALDISYIAIIIAKRVWEHRVPFKPGPWSLGRYGKLVNAIAVCWVSVIAVILFFPTEYPVTKDNMNYAVVVCAAVALFSLAFWFAGARRSYKGPLGSESDVIKEIGH